MHRAMLQIEFAGRHTFVKGRNTKKEHVEAGHLRPKMHSREPQKDIWRIPNVVYSSANANSAGISYVA